MQITRVKETSSFIAAVRSVSPSYSIIHVFAIDLITLDGLRGLFIYVPGMELLILGE